MTSRSILKTPNIGKVLAEKLIEAGISNSDELKSIGSEKAFIRLKAIDTAACINTLYALEGAIQGIRWHDIDKSRKAELKHFFDEC